MKKLSIVVAVLCMAAIGLIAAGTFSAPSSVLHVVTVKWKADSTAQQQQAAIDGIKAMAAQVPGLRTIWVKKVKVQPADYSTVFAMEFETAAAFDSYTSNAAHKNWEKVYLPIREESHTVDITN